MNPELPVLCALALTLATTAAVGTTTPSTTAAAATATDDCVILLHGLARSHRSMNRLEKAFRLRGHRVANFSYPSRKFPIEKLAPIALNRGLQHCNAQNNSRIHVVTHSMGGILLRQYLTSNKIENLGRVVMIAPPNQGSEVVDYFASIPGFRSVNGPAGLQLGTDRNGIPRQLPAADFDVAVIAGTVSINFLLSTQLPGPNDGKVTVAATKLEGMRDFISMPHSHPMLLRRQAVIDQVIHYIESGSFKHTNQQ